MKNEEYNQTVKHLFTAKKIKCNILHLEYLINFEEYIKHLPQTTLYEINDYSSFESKDHISDYEAISTFDWSRIKIKSISVSSILQLYTD